LALDIALRHAGRAADPCAVPKSSEIFAILERTGKSDLKGKRSTATNQTSVRFKSWPMVSKE
jgi:hypothetical protein